MPGEPVSLLTLVDRTAQMSRDWDPMCLEARSLEGPLPTGPLTALSCVPGDFSTQRLIASGPRTTGALQAIGPCKGGLTALASSCRWMRRGQTAPPSSYRRMRRGQTVPVPSCRWRWIPANNQGGSACRGRPWKQCFWASTGTTSANPVQPRSMPETSIPLTQALLQVYNLTGKLAEYVAGRGHPKHPGPVSVEDDQATLASYRAGVSTTTRKMIYRNT
jgi:hypothetical protein